MPPLDDPVALVDWWQRRKKQTVPVDLLSARADAIRHAAPSDPPPASGDKSTTTTFAKSAASDSAPRSRANIEDFATVEALDLASAVKRQKQALSVIQRDYEQALCDANTDESTLTLRAGRVDKCLERLRKLEKDLAERERESGELVHRNTLRDELAPVFASLADSLVSHLVDSLGIDRPVALRFADDWFATLRTSRFLTAALPANSTPPTSAADTARAA